MKTLSRLLAATVFGATLATGCSSLGEKLVGKRVDDTAITSDVKAKFVADTAVSALNIKVNTYQGTVQLSGFAKSAEEAERAVQLARSVGGVKMVKNDIRLTQ